jgi:hypothetical protein
VRAAGGQRGGQLSLQRLELCLDAGQLGELVGQQPSPSASDLVTGPDAGQ